MKRPSLVAAMLMLASGATWAETPKWGPHIDLEGKLGSDRHLGEADLFLPVLQDADTLLFVNLRTRLDDTGGREGNFGLGVRRMLESGWNLGGYSYFDRRRSDLDNYFSQITLGVEALGRDWDLRANLYRPVGAGRHRVDGLNTAEISGTSVIFRGGEERSLNGIDAEIGWRVPLFDVDSGINLRIYGGGYHFSADGVPDVAGPRGRLDLTFDSVPRLWQGSRLSLGAEWQHDDPRGSQGFLSARLRIPLQVFGQSPSRLTPQERRMVDPVIRDVDIVSQAGTFGAPETATALNGGTVAVVDSASAPTTAALNSALSAAGVNSTVILSGTFNTNNTVTLQTGQTVMGAGNLTVRSPSGRTAMLAVSTGATITAMTATSSIGAITMADNSTLSGMVINQTQNPANSDPYGVNVSNRSNVTIVGNVITVVATNGSAFGTFILDSSNVTVRNNTISATRLSAVAASLYVNNSSVTVAGNTLSATGNTTYASFLVAGSGNVMTIQPGSTGNVFTSGICGTAGTGVFSGSFAYTSAGVSANCP